MAERVVRCPYCVVGNEFMPMIALADGAFACAKCGHLELPGNDDLKCQCSSVIAPGASSCGRSTSVNAGKSYRHVSLPESVKRCPYIQRAGLICDNQSCAVGMHPRSSRTCCSPM
jgi:hypothetical protein